MTVLRRVVLPPAEVIGGFDESPLADPARCWRSRRSGNVVTREWRGGTASAAGQGAPHAAAHCPWLNTSLSVQERVNLLLAKMTLADKVDLMEGHNYYAPNGAIGYTDPIAALCVPI